MMDTCSRLGYLTVSDEGLYTLFSSLNRMPLASKWVTQARAPLGGERSMSRSEGCSGPVAQLLACIGEQFTEGDEVCGIVVNVRAKQDKLCIWTKTAANEAAQAPPLPAAPIAHLPT